MPSNTLSPLPSIIGALARRGLVVTDAHSSSCKARTLDDVARVGAGRIDAARPRSSGCAPPSMRALVMTGGRP
jgi:hypothetical protein